MGGDGWMSGSNEWMDGWRDGGMNEWMVLCFDGWIDGWRDGWIELRKDKQTEIRMDRWLDGNNDGLFEK